MEETEDGKSFCWRNFEEKISGRKASARSGRVRFKINLILKIF